MRFTSSRTPLGNCSRQRYLEARYPVHPNCRHPAPFYLCFVAQTMQLGSMAPLGTQRSAKMLTRLNPLRTARQSGQEGRDGNSG